VPVFADIDETLCLDPAAVRAAIGPDTRAVIPVHMCGSMARIDALAELCDEEGLILIEDTAQAVGASYKGKAAGSFGRMGCFSFDPVKTITCGEGGAVVTDDAELYARADQYADHGHDHVGHDRGLEGHPILGTNHRISELNAAVGLAQLRKLDRILEIQRRNQLRLREALSRYPGITFRDVPDPAGDSATFLSFFLPDEAAARDAAAELGRAGVDGCFYWYDNNWHYLRRWDHLKRMQTPARTALHQLDRLPDFDGVELDRSDRIMGRTISMSIKLSWEAKDLDERVARIDEVFRG
jgi:8-amino-3,8-dideoxy-alpha-D-manno-octulosonate transaminase